jgi:hypothetical protein
METDKKDRSNFPKESSQSVSVYTAVPRDTNPLLQHSPIIFASVLAVGNICRAEIYHFVSIIYFRITAFLDFLHLPEF